MSTFLKMEADELLAEAKMSDTIILIVEGNDDISIYEDIILTLTIEKDIEVYASENLEKISCKKSGCSGVKESLKKIKECSNGIEYDKHILGIIDRDATVYRGDDNDINGLLVLKYYSIESHFVTKEVIPLIISYFTKISHKSIDPNLKEKLFDEIYNKLKILYYISLEALKKSCQNEYNALYQYGEVSTISIKKNQHKMNQLTEKKEELDSFAQTFNISMDFDSLLLICKGKWLLEDFIFELNNQLKTLNKLCKEKEINQCQYCENGTHDNCLYKFSSNEIKSIKRVILKYVEISELDYIREKIYSLN